MIRYSCPHCGERIQVDESKAGRAHACPLCDRSTLVPDHRPAQPVPHSAPPPARPTPPQVPVLASPPATELPPEVRIARLEALRGLEQARPLVQTEWLEAAEHYRALHQPALAAQMEQRAAIAAQVAGGLAGPGGQPQIVIVNQNTNTNQTSQATSANARSNSADSCGGCVGAATLVGCLWFWAQFGCLLPILGSLLTVALALRL